MTSRDRSVGTAQVLGGAVLAAEGSSIPAHAQAHHARKVGRAKLSAVGNLGGLSPEGRPVDPLTLSGKRGREIPDGQGERYKSPRAEASERFKTKSKPFDAKLAKPPLRGKAGALLRLAAPVAGVGLAARGAHNLSKPVVPEVPAYFGKAVNHDDDLVVSPQYGVGIPSTRANPLSPLALASSAGIMADSIIGATGRKVSKRERKVVVREATRLAGARGMLFSPLGQGSRVTG